MIQLVEIRKLQKTGGASFIVSLPKSWVESQGLKEQSKVGILNRDNMLVIVPSVDPQQAQRVKVINVDGIDHDRFLFRLLVGAYVMGYNQISIQSETRLDSLAKTTARKFIHDAIGLEIIEETSNSMMIKDLLNPSEMKFKSWIERMSQLVINQQEDAFRALVERDADAAKNIIARDIEVNRLHWLISRQYNILMRNIAFTEMLDEQERRGMNYPLISKNMERLGDYAARISENNLLLLEKDAIINKEILDAVIDAGKNALSIFRRSIDTFFTGNMSDANQVIESVNDLVATCEKIENMAIQQETIVGICVGYINEAIRRTGEHSADIGEYIINFSINEKS